MRIIFLTSVILSVLSPSFLHSSHWCHFPAVSVSLLCCPLLHLCLSSLFSTPHVLPAAEFKEGTSGPCGCTLKEVLPVASWSKSNLRGTGGILDIGQDFKLLSSVFRKNTSEQGTVGTSWKCRACLGIVFHGVLGLAKDVECKTVVDKGLKLSKAVPLKPVVLQGHWHILSVLP